MHFLCTTIWWDKWDIGGAFHLLADENTMVGQWWDNGGTMVGQWWDNSGTMVAFQRYLNSEITSFAPPFGGTMVGQWWDHGGTMVGQWWDHDKDTPKRLSGK